MYWSGNVNGVHILQCRPLSVVRISFLSAVLPLCIMNRMLSKSSNDVYIPSLNGRLNLHSTFPPAFERDVVLRGDIAGIDQLAGNS